MPGWIDALAPALEARVGAFLDEHPVPGAAAGVVVGASLAWSTGRGFCDLDAGTSPDASTAFRIASITKSFTATAVVRLRDDGLLGLDDPLTEHLPELKVAGNPFGPIEDVTIRRVLLHRSGLVSEPPLIDWRANRHPSLAETLDAADRIKVVVPPDSTNKYSNLGYQLLGEVVERVSGSPFREMIRSSILEPLGMRATAFEPPEGPRLAVGYDRGAFEDAPRRSAGRDKPTDAEGGLWSTVEDLARWIGFQLTGEAGVEAPLSKASLREMQRPLVLTDEAWTSAQGLSWYHARREDRVYVGHSGGTPGFSARVAFSVPHGIGAIVLLNGHGPATDLAFDLADALVAARREHAPTLAHTRPRPAPEEVRPYLGVYVWPDFEETLRVEWRGEALSLVWVGGEPGTPPTLEPTGEPDTFTIRGGRETGERCVFRRDARGRVIGVDAAGYPLQRLHSAD